ncbi:MAG: HlyD family efflux transporter periplasmic adaptor subunit [Rhodocyclaceae bacterium]|nr:HlyD family efflux transporter periplasmic adaptor subunit [Rhodocyclaceae bacterium]
MNTWLMWSSVLLLAATPLSAHEGHTHGDEAPLIVRGDAPQRLADGTVFLPKRAQRQMALRTEPLLEAALPQVVELPGRVVLDPQRGGLVQASIGGRLDAPDGRGLPVVGSTVRQGQILAWLTPASSRLERAGQQAQIAEWQAALHLAEQRLARLQQLVHTVPRKEIEAAASEVRSLAGRLAAGRSGLAGRDALRAPVDGVIASSQVVAGQVVEARDVLFEIAAPDRLQVEALAYAPLAVTTVAGASIAVDGRTVDLNFIGAGGRLREQALPLRFGRQGAGTALPLGLALPVFVQLKAAAPGLALPQRALVRSPANESIVWVKTAPERFSPRGVRSEPFDGARVIVRSGLQAGERVVTEGAALLNQIR